MVNGPFSKTRRANRRRVLVVRWAFDEYPLLDCVQWVNENDDDGLFQCTARSYRQWSMPL
jgi:hypothetical protein